MGSPCSTNAHDVGFSLERAVRDVQMRALDLDLKLAPPGLLGYGLSRFSDNREAQAEAPNVPGQQAETDVEVLDEELSIISPRMFDEMTRNYRCNQRVVVNDFTQMFDDSVGASEATTRNRKRKRTTADHPIDNQVVSHAANNNETSNTASMALAPIPQTSTLSCPICMNVLTEATSTKCGHVFCMKCIKTALGLQTKCPTCRQKVGKRGIFRIYLPCTE